MPQYLFLPVLPPASLLSLRSRNHLLSRCSPLETQTHAFRAVLVFHDKTGVQNFHDLHRFVGQLPVRWLVPELQRPAAGRGVRAAVRGRQRSSVRSQHLQHLHSHGPQSESSDGATLLHKTEKLAKYCSCRFPPVLFKGRNPKADWVNPFGYGLNAAEVYSSVTKERW